MLLYFKLFSINEKYGLNVGIWFNVEILLNWEEMGSEIQEKRLSSSKP